MSAFEKFIADRNRIVDALKFSEIPTIQFNKDCHPSQAKGFVWDSTSVINEIVACTTVRDKYKKGLETGAVDPDTVWEQMKAEFEEAGVQKIIEEKQRQLDAWLAENK